MTYNRIIYTIAILSVFFTSAICAQDGNLDPTFSSEFSTAAFVAGGLQSDGKIVLAGAWSIGEEDAIQGIIRLNSDGTVDNSFNVINSGLITSSIRKIIVQPDDKLLICGVFTFLNGVFRRCVARLHPDGQIDESFDPGDSVELSGQLGLAIEAMALQPDGKIVIGGKFNIYNGQPVANGVIRLNDDGTLDTTFDAAPAFGQGMVTNYYLGIDIQSDGKIILGGDFDFGEGTYGDVSGLVRLNTDGSFDNTFNTLNLQNKEALMVSDVQVDDLDNIYVVGQLWGFNPQFVYEHLTTHFKLGPDGTVNENHLNTVYYQTAFSAYNIALLSDWKVMYSGLYDNPIGNGYYGIVRSMPSGLFDFNFNNEIPIPDPGSSKFIQQQDGKILCYSWGGFYNGSPVVGIWRIESTPAPPCGVTFDVFPDVFNDNTLNVVPEYEGFPDLDYLWSFGDGNTSDEMFPYHTYSADGEYELCATITASENGSAFCMESFCTTVSDDMTSGIISLNDQTYRQSGFSINVIHPNSVGMSESHKTMRFQIFPNPTHGEFFLRTDWTERDIVNVMVTNTVGKVIVKKQFSNGGEITDLQVIDLSGQPSGLYFVQFDTDNFRELHKVVVY